LIRFSSTIITLPAFSAREIFKPDNDFPSETMNPSPSDGTRIRRNAQRNPIRADGLPSLSPFPVFSTALLYWMVGRSH
jgi:hypothetical protein